jgi:hypothetical protein
MNIRHLAFIDTPDAKNQASTQAPANRKPAPAKPSAHFPFASSPGFVLKKMHFTGIANGSVGSLATALMREPLPFSRLEELIPIALRI